MLSTLYTRGGRLTPIRPSTPPPTETETPPETPPETPRPLTERERRIQEYERDLEAIENEYREVVSEFNRIVSLPSRTRDENIESISLANRRGVLALRHRTLRNELRNFLLTNDDESKDNDDESKDNEQQGEGVLTRDPSIYPPDVRAFIEKYDENISTIKLIRTPLNSMTKTLLNIASFGQLDKVMKQLGVDKFFHLSMLINGRAVLEKNEVIKMYNDKNIVKSNSEVLDLPYPLPKQLTIKELTENTRKRMGDRLGPYNAKDNNCSVFIDNVLKANGLDSQETDKFLSQKTVELFDAFPSLTKNITDTATGLAAVVDRQIKGEGQGDIEHELYNFGLHRCKIKF